ncbi:MAG: hypothetical protein KAS32_27045 [Candidatus Peribacteraceae bacterium]|nr:hypothetical protein [Candidatus Peribacteraceae bacterium]
MKSSERSPIIDPHDSSKNDPVYTYVSEWLLNKGKNRESVNMMISALNRDVRALFSFVSQEETGGNRLRCESCADENFDETGNFKGHFLYERIKSSALSGETEEAFRNRFEIELKNNIRYAFYSLFSEHDFDDEENVIQHFGFDSPFEGEVVTVVEKKGKKCFVRIVNTKGEIHQNDGPPIKIGYQSVENPSNN